MTSPKNLLKLQPTIRRRCHRSATRIHPIGPQRRTFQSPQTALLPATSAQTELVVNDAAASSLPSSTSSSTCYNIRPACPTKATPLFGHQGMSAAERREMLRLAALLPAHLRVQNPQAQPAVLVQNAAHYIAQLTATVVARVHNGSLTEEALGQLLPTANNESNNGCHRLRNNGKRGQFKNAERARKVKSTRRMKSGK